MKRRSLTASVLAASLLLAGVVLLSQAQEGIAADAPKAKVLIVAGPCQHPPGTHEAAAGARLLTHCIEHAENIGPVSAELWEAWPKEGGVPEGTSTIVFIGDIFPPERMDDRDKIMAELTKLMDQGCGIVCIHYATGLRGEHVSEDGDHPLLHWMGGYFATGGCKHHRSTARVCPATLVPEDADHPILEGWKKFAFDDEPYWNNYFGKDGMAPNVTSLVYAMLPATDPKKETIGWAVQRKDGGRGVGLVVPHFFRNWRIDDLRTLVLNSIVWTAKLDVPAAGVKSALPDLATFKPDAVDPQPRRKRN